MFSQNPDSVRYPVEQSPASTPAGIKQAHIMLAADGFLCFTHEHTPARTAFEYSTGVLCAP